MKELSDPKAPVLIIDDEIPFLDGIKVALSLAGVANVRSCSDSREVAPLLSREPPSAILLDLHMPFVSGWELIPIIDRECPGVPVIVVTADDETDAVVRAIKAGAADYLTKPVDRERLVAVLGRALTESPVLASSRPGGAPGRERLAHPTAFASIITHDSRMEAIFGYVEAVAATSLPVLITGETGTGKELVARALHEVSERKGRFVAVDVAGLQDTLFSDTLFGHRKGAYTGAESDRKGIIGQAAGGTLFLDEVGDLSAESQIHLLRLLQERIYYPLGTDEPQATDARIVFATNRDLEAKTRDNQFRKDLFYRLGSHHIELPPLRERVDDIPLLVEHFVAIGAENAGKTRPIVPGELYDLLRAYDFPGNVRELEGMVYDAMVRHRSGVLSLADFKATVFKRISSVGGSAASTGPDPGGGAAQLFARRERLPTLKEAESALVAEALRRANGNQTVAAQSLGLTRQALNNRLRRSRR